MKPALLACCVMFASGTALAHSGATGIVKERMDMMKDLGVAMKALVQQSKAHTVERGVIIQSRETIITHADHLVRMFPVGSDKKPSEAAPAIWTDGDKFKGLFSDMKSAAIALSSGPNAKPLSEQIAVVSATCKACHQQFRIKR